MVLPETSVHIVQRGHDRQSCFRHDTDYLVYLTNLRDLANSMGCALHAYCLMTNHVHLLVTPSCLQGCARLMRNLGQRYVQYFNRRYERRGTLWEGRFRSCLVDSAGYVLACHRYIELNPVRAGMVPSPGEYRWSSHNGNIGLACNKLLTPHAEVLALGANDALRRAAYEELFAAGDEPTFLAEIRDATNGGFALVSERLKSTLPPDVQRRLQRRPPGPPPTAIGRPNPLQVDLELELGLRPRTS